MTVIQLAFTIYYHLLAKRNNVPFMLVSVVFVQQQIHAAAEMCTFLSLCCSIVLIPTFLKGF